MLTHRARTILGDIPPDWERELLEDLLLYDKGGDWGEDSGEVAIQVLRSTNFTDCGVLDFHDVAARYFPLTKSPGMGLKDKDLLLERSGGGPTQPVGRIGFITKDLPSFWFSNFVQLLRSDPSKIDPEFLGWVLLELNRCGVIERLQHQTTQMRNLDYRDYLRVYLPKPNPEEQRAIALTMSIANGLKAAAKAKLVAAQRLKAALLQQLFTRGIPGQHTQFKQTKIGEIPERWEVVTIRSILDGVPFNGVSPQSRPDPPGIPILNVQCIEDGICTTRHVSYVDVDKESQEECRAEKGDFYVLRGNGNRDYVATGGLLTVEPEPGTIFSDKLIRLRFQSTKVADRFVPYLWQSPTFLHRLQSKAECGSGLWMMGKRDICREVCACPSSREEQENIVGLVDVAISSISACEEELFAVDRLIRALLQSLLTGQVRMRISDLVNGNIAASRTA